MEPKQAIEKLCNWGERLKRYRHNGITTFEGIIPAPIMKRPLVREYMLDIVSTMTSAGGANYWLHSNNTGGVLITIIANVDSLGSEAMNEINAITVGGNDDIAF